MKSNRSKKASGNHFAFNGRMSILLLAAAILALTSCVRLTACEENEVSILVDAWLKAHTSEKDNAAWQKKVMGRIQDAEKSGQDDSEESAATRILTDYVASILDGMENFTLRSTPKTELCLWFKLFDENGWTLPERLSKHLTADNTRKTLEGNHNEKKD